MRKLKATLIIALLCTVPMFAVTNVVFSSTVADGGGLIFTPVDGVTPSESDMIGDMIVTYQLGWGGRNAELGSARILKAGSNLLEEDAFSLDRGGNLAINFYFYGNYADTHTQGYIVECENGWVFADNKNIKNPVVFDTINVDAEGTESGISVSSDDDGGTFLVTSNPGLKNNVLVVTIPIHWNANANLPAGTYNIGFNISVNGV